MIDRTIDITFIFLLGFAALFTLLGALRVARFISRPNFWIRRFFFLVFRGFTYTLVWRRPNGSSNVTVFTFFSLTALTILNTFTLLFRSTTTSDISQRAARLFLINLIPVTLGNGSSLLPEVLGLYYRRISAIHRWIWRICFVNGMVHTIIQLTVSPLHLGLSEITVSRVFTN